MAFKVEVEFGKGNNIVLRPACLRHVVQQSGLGY